MHWEIQPLSRNSTLTEAPFEEGDRVVCLLLRNEKGELARCDVKPDEVEQVSESMQLLGRWSRLVKAKEDEDKEAQKQSLQSSEELFLSLYESEHQEDEGLEILKQILALMLERKRVLRPLSKDRKAIVPYLHVKTKREYPVSLQDFPSQKLVELESQLQCVIV